MSENAVKQSGQMSRSATQLSDEHAHLERWFLEISQLAAAGDQHDCDAAWDDFQRELELHLAFEEREIFPHYEKSRPDQAAIIAELRQDHAAIRAQLVTIGVDLQLHMASAEVIESFLSLLRKHARRERDSLYAWLLASDTP